MLAGAPAVDAGEGGGVGGDGGRHGGHAGRDMRGGGALVRAFDRRVDWADARDANSRSRESQAKRNGFWLMVFMGFPFVGDV